MPREVPEEGLVGVLQDVRGHVSDMSYDLAITSERLIAAVVREPAEIPPRITMTELLLGDSLSRLRTLVEAPKEVERRRNLYANRTFDELVTAYHRNFELRFADVERLHLKKGLTTFRLTFHLSNPHEAGVHRFRFTLKRKRLGQAMELFGRALPTRLHPEG